MVGVGVGSAKQPDESQTSIVRRAYFWAHGTVSLSTHYLADEHARENYSPALRFFDAASTVGSTR